MKGMRTMLERQLFIIVLSIIFTSRGYGFPSDNIIQAAALRLEAKEERQSEHYQIALDKLNMALSLISDSTDNNTLLERCSLLKELGITTSLLRQNPRIPEEYFHSALSLAKLISAMSETANLERDLGIFHRQAAESAQFRLLTRPMPFELLTEHLDKSRSYLVKALESYRHLNEVKPLGDTLCELSTTYQMIGDLFETPQLSKASRTAYASAEVYLVSAELFLGSPLIERGNLSFRKHDYISAAHIFRACRDRAIKDNKVSEEAISNQNLGMALLATYRKAGDPSILDECIRSLSRAADLAENARVHTGIGPFSEQRSGFFSERVFIHEQLIDLFLSLDRPSEAFIWAEKAKARGFLDLFRNSADRLVSSPSIETDFSLESLSHLIPEGTGVLEFFIGDLGVFRFILNSAGLQEGKKLPIKTNHLLELVMTFRKRCLDNSRGNLFAYNGRGINLAFQKESNLLFQELLSDRWNELLKYKQIIIIPHHILHYLPFHALTIESSTSTAGPSSTASSFWIEKGPPIGYAPSVQSLSLFLMQPQPNISTLSAFANPQFPDPRQNLPETQRTAEFIRSITTTANRIFLDKDFLTSQFIQQWSGCDVLYVGTHGLLDAEDPMHSSIVFPPSTGKNMESCEYLTTGKVLSLAGRSPQLVILSACQSGLSEVDPSAGDDLVGLSRAFLSRGVKGVVSTLWSVPDSTSPDVDCGFIEGFIQHGYSGPESMAYSGRAFLKRARTDIDTWKFRAHPYWWAAFTYTGDPRPPLLIKKTLDEK